MRYTEIMNNWYVITGASSSGKTTLTTILQEKGYPVVFEAARTLIDQEIAKGKTIEDIRKDELGFQSKILDMKITIEKNLPKEKITFLDRGIPDTYAYNKLYKVSHDAVLEKAISDCSYKKVFLLDQLPYIIDYARTESKEQQDLLHQYLEEAYRSHGFDLVRVPVLSVEQRVEFILKNL